MLQAGQLFRYAYRLPFTLQTTSRFPATRTGIHVPSSSCWAFSKAVQFGLERSVACCGTGEVAGSWATPSTSKPARSGHASSIAFRIASSRVIADDAQLLQVP